MDHNIYFDASGGQSDFEGMNFEKWQATGKDAGSIQADPTFVDAGRFDFRLKPGSAAKKVGFESFDFSQAGVHGDSAWVDLARTEQYPPLEIPPGPSRAHVAAAEAPPLAADYRQAGLPVDGG